MDYLFSCVHLVLGFCSKPLSWLSVYVGIRQAKMAAIAGTRPSITTNAIIIEMIAAIFLFDRFV